MLRLEPQTRPKLPQVLDHGWLRDGGAPAPPMPMGSLALQTMRASPAAQATSAAAAATHDTRPHAPVYSASASSAAPPTAASTSASASACASASASACASVSTSASASASVFARLSTPQPTGSGDYGAAARLRKVSKEQLLQQLNLDDGPTYELGPVPIERRTPLTRGDALRESIISERIKREEQRMKLMMEEGMAESVM